VLYWLRQAGVLLVTGVAVLAFSGVRETPARLLSMYGDLWQRGDAVRLEWRTEGAGEDLLAPRVRAMLALLRDNRVESFRYSAAIASDADASVVQRIAESAYPIRVKQDAKDLLLLSDESLAPHCKAVASKLEVVLARCS
jgi:hypothetical protein